MVNFLTIKSTFGSKTNQGAGDGSRRQPVLLAVSDSI